ncbi:MAG: hypothetical protein JRH20_24765 [Deltaproteobacteria bacterium]|nr:hypothetical protein [Deltaproteobacteria bacterium]
MAENTLTPFKRADGEDVEERLRLLQENLERCLQFIDQCPIIDGRLIEDVEILAATTTIKHGLGRTPRGWVVVGKLPTFHVIVELSRSSTTLVLDVNAAVSVTVDLWVF